MYLAALYIYILCVMYIQWFGVYTTCSHMCLYSAHHNVIFAHSWMHVNGELCTRLLTRVVAHWCPSQYANFCTFLLNNTLVNGSNILQACIVVLKVGYSSVIMHVIDAAFLV